MSPSTDSVPPLVTERKPMKLPLVFLFGFLASAVVVGGLIWLFAAYEAGRLWPFAYNPRIDQDKWFEVIRNAVTTAAALGVGITLFFSYRRQQTAEQNQRVAAEAQLVAAKAQQTAAAALELSTKQHALDQDRRKDAVAAELRTRYAQTAEQLGSSHLAVRVASIYSVAALADDWAAVGNEDERQVCIDLLCAYFRSDQLGEDSAVKREIADAIWQVITERLATATPARKYWGGSRIRLEGAGQLPSYWDSLVLTGGGKFSLEDASLNGHTEWCNINLDGGQASISGLHLGSHALTIIKMDVVGSGALWMKLPYEEVGTTRLIRFFRVKLLGGSVWIDAPGCRISFEYCEFLSGAANIHTVGPAGEQGDSITFRHCLFQEDVFRTGRTPDKNMGPTTGLVTSVLDIGEDCRFQNGATVLVSTSTN